MKDFGDKILWVFLTLLVLWGIVALGKATQIPLVSNFAHEFGG